MGRHRNHALSALNVKNGHLTDSKTLGMFPTRSTSDGCGRTSTVRYSSHFGSTIGSGLYVGWTEYMYGQRLFGLRPIKTNCTLLSLSLSAIPYWPASTDITSHGSTVGGIRQHLLRKVEVMLPMIDYWKHTQILFCRFLRTLTDSRGRTAS